MTLPGPARKLILGRRDSSSEQYAYILERAGRTCIDRMASFPSTTVQPSPDVVSRRLGDSAVLVHLETNRVFELNETGARVWELLHDGLTCEQIADRLAAEFEVDHDRAASTVLELVSDLRREGLLRP